MSTKHGLNKNLKKLDTLALAFGAMIGWSWVALISGIIGRGGSAGGIIGTIIVGFIILSIGLIYAELASAMPDVGGASLKSRHAARRRLYWSGLNQGRGLSALFMLGRDGTPTITPSLSASFRTCLMRITYFFSDDADKFFSPINSSMKLSTRL